MEAAWVSGVDLHFADEGPQDDLAMVFCNSLGTDLRLWGGLLPHQSRFAGDVGALIRDRDLGQAVFVDLSIGGPDGATPPDLLRAPADPIPGARRDLIQDACHIPCAQTPTVGGSSIMPQKSNPVAAEAPVSIARLKAGGVSMIHGARIYAQERDGLALGVEWRTLVFRQIASSEAGTLATALLSLRPRHPGPPSWRQSEIPASLADHHHERRTT